MKKKQAIDFIISIFLLIFAIIIIILSSLGISNLKEILSITYSTYLILKLIQFIIIYKDKDYESLFTFLISLLALGGVLLVNSQIKYLLLNLFIWLSLLSLIKLKKADYFHDRHNKMWIISLFILFSFLIISILISYNLYLESVNSLLIGLLLFINSFMDSLIPIVEYLIGGNIIENSK